MKREQSESSLFSTVKKSKKDFKGRTKSKGLPKSNSNYTKSYDDLLALSSSPVLSVEQVKVLLNNDKSLKLLKSAANSGTTIKIHSRYNSTVEGTQSAHLRKTLIDETLKESIQKQNLLVEKRLFDPFKYFSGLGSSSQESSAIFASKTNHKNDRNLQQMFNPKVYKVANKKDRPLIVKSIEKSNQNQLYEHKEHKLAGNQGRDKECKQIKSTEEILEKLDRLESFELKLKANRKQPLPETINNKQSPMSSGIAAYHQIKKIYLKRELSSNSNKENIDTVNHTNNSISQCSLSQRESLRSNSTSSIKLRKQEYQVVPLTTREHNRHQANLWKHHYSPIRRYEGSKKIERKKQYQNLQSQRDGTDSSKVVTDNERQFSSFCMSVVELEQSQNERIKGVNCSPKKYVKDMKHSYLKMNLNSMQKVRLKLKLTTKK